MSRIKQWVRYAALGCLGSAAIACSGSYDVSVEGPANDAAIDAEVLDDVASAEGVSDASGAALGTTEQELIGLFTGISFLDSCNDITGTDPVLAALAVSTATELRRWQPKLDFDIWSGKLRLTAAGKKRCADGVCWNTQALLDLQNDSARNAMLRPGVKVNPLLIRTVLSLAYFRQATCFSLLGLPLVGCGVPEHQFTVAHSEPGKCDTNYWFTTSTPAGKPLTATVMKQLEKSLIWVNAETNAYIAFQTNGNMVGVDPTYGLNEAGSTQTGACSVACTKMSSRNISGQCCSCNGTKKYARSAWSTNTYICQ